MAETLTPENVLYLFFTMLWALKAPLAVCFLGGIIIAKIKG